MISDAEVLAQLEERLARAQDIATHPFTVTGKFAHIADLAAEGLDLVRLLQCRRGFPHQRHWVAGDRQSGGQCPGRYCEGRERVPGVRGGD